MASRRGGSSFRRSTSALVAARRGRRAPRRAALAARIAAEAWRRLRRHGRERLVLLLRPGQRQHLLGSTGAWPSARRSGVVASSAMSAGPQHQVIAMNDLIAAVEPEYIGNLRGFPPDDLLGVGPVIGDEPAGDFRSVFGHNRYRIATRELSLDPSDPGRQKAFAAR